MNKITNLKGLFKKELSNLYNAELRILKILPLFYANVSSTELKEILENHIEQTQLYINRLEKIFRNMNIRPLRIKCSVIEELAEESSSKLKFITDPFIKDIAVLSYFNKMEHYEIAGYGNAVIYAHRLAEIENQDILQATLDEEIELEEILSEIAAESYSNKSIEEWKEEQVL